MKNITKTIRKALGLTKLWLTVVLVISVTVVNILHLGGQDKALAATSSTINFQARLLSSSGNLVADGYYNVQFNLYSASSGGTSEWTETYYDSNGVSAGNDNRVRVVNGYLSVYLGSQTSFPSTIDWDQQQWLTINIGGTAQTATPTWDGEMSPRLQLSAVPYALTSGSLQNTSGANELKVNLSTPTADVTYTFQDAAAGSYNVCTTASVCSGYASASGSGSYIQNGTSPQTADFNITGTGVIGTSLTTPLIQSTAGLTVTGGTTLTLQSTGTNAVSLDSGTTGAINIGTGSNAKTITIGNGTGATSVVINAGTGAINIGTNAVARTTTIGNGTGASTSTINCGTGGCNLGTNAVAHTTTVGSTTGAATTTIQGGTGGINIGTNNVAQTIQIGNTANAVSQSINIGTNTTASSTSTVNIGSQIGTSPVTVKSGTGNITLNPVGSSNTGVVVKPTNDSTKAFQVQYADSTPLFTVDTTNGEVGIGTAGPLAGNELYVLSNSDTVIRGKNTGTADLLQLANSTSDVLVVNNAGQLQLATQGSTGGLQIGGDTLLYRSAANTISLGSNDSLAIPGGDLSVDGGDITTAATTFNLLAGATTAINIGPASTTAVSINLAGGSSDTGCTVTGNNGNLTCSGTITTTNTSGTVGFWTRNNGTALLQPATTGDSVRVSNAGGELLTLQSNAGGTYLDSQSSASNDWLVAGKVLADANQRYILKTNGEMQWGNGTSAPDIILTRSGAGALNLQPTTGNNSTHALRIQDASGNAIFAVDNTTTNGRIGIGTDTPNASLEIRRATNATENAIRLSTTSENDWKIYQPTGSSDLRLWNDQENTDTAIFGLDGNVTLQTPSTDNVNAFLVKDSSGGTAFTVDTTRDNIAVGASATDAKVYAQSGAYTVFRGNSTSTNKLLELQSSGTDVLQVSSTGNITDGGSFTGTTATTSGTGTNTTTVTLTAGAFANNDVIYIDNAGQDYVTRIVSGGGTTTLTVSPAVTFENARTVTKSNVQYLGNNGSTFTGLTRSANSYFQGYFTGGIVTGTGSTTYSDGNISSLSAFQISAPGTLIKPSSDGNAFQIQDASGNNVLNVTATGTSHFFDIQAGSTQLSNILQVRDSTGVQLFRVSSGGSTVAEKSLYVGYDNSSRRIYFGSAGDTSLYRTAAGSLAVQPSSGNDSTTAFQVQNAAGTGILNVDTSNKAVTITGSTSGSNSQTFNYTGGTQTFTVPAGVTSINVTLYGAGGGSGGQGNTASTGGQTTGTLAVTPGQVLTIYVGGAGSNGTSAGVGGAGGYNGGGAGGNAYSSSYPGGGGGGGASMIKDGTTLEAAAGGGGGGAGYGTGSTAAGGNGGGTTGNTGNSSRPGTGGTQSAGGAGYGGGSSTYCGTPATNGSAGQGGAGGIGTGGPFSGASGSGGGGGGYYGGGGGDCGTASGNGGGGGGSGYSALLTGASMTTGGNSGNGQVAITWTPPALLVQDTSNNSYFSVDSTNSQVATFANTALFKNTSDNTTAFQIQNASGSSLLLADTANSQLIVRATSTVSGGGANGGTGSGTSSDAGGGGGGAIGTVNAPSVSGGTGANGAQSVDVSGLFSVLSAVGGYPTTSPGSGNGNGGTYCVPQNGGNATGFGTGGGGANFWGGSGGNGLYGGGGGGASGGTGCPSYSGGTGGAGVVVISFSDGTKVVQTSGSSYTVPSGATSAKVWAIGAGGGGAGSPTGDNFSGGGGGAGAVVYRTFAVVAGQSITYSRGTGGAGGTGAANGSAGGSTTATYGSITITAGGGSGGQYNNNSTGAGGTYSGQGTILPLDVQNSSGTTLLNIDSTNSTVNSTSIAISGPSLTGGAPLTIRNTGSSAGKYWSVGPETGNNFHIYNQSGTGQWMGDGATTWTANSDERLKTNITSIDDGDALTKLLQLNPVTYNWKDVNNNPDVTHIGFLAQDVQQLFPSLVSTGGDITMHLADGSTETVQNALGVDYTSLIVPTIAAIKQLNNNLSQTQILQGEHTTAIDQLETSINEINGKVDASGSQLVILSDANLQGSVTVSGNSTLQGNLSAGQDFSVAGKTGLYSDLSVNGTTRLKSNLKVDGAAQLQQATASSLYITGTATADMLTANVANVNQIYSASASITNLDVNGTATIGTLHVTGDSIFDSKVTISSAFITKGDAPTIDYLDAAWQDNDSNTIEQNQAQATVNGNNIAGTITLTTGDNPVAGQLLKLTFSTPFDSPPRVVFSPANDNATNLKVFRDETTNEYFILKSTNAPTANTTYKFDYFIVQAQQ